MCTCVCGYYIYYLVYTNKREDEAEGEREIERVSQSVHYTVLCLFRDPHSNTKSVYFNSERFDYAVFPFFLHYTHHSPKLNRRNICCCCLCGGASSDGYSVITFRNFFFFRLFFFIFKIYVLFTLSILDT